MAVLGLRYPKPMVKGDFPLSSTTFQQGAIGGATQFLAGQSGARLWCAPSRYSQVRKVVFWVTTRQDNAISTADFNVRLRLTASSTSDSTRLIRTFNIAAGDTQLWQDQAFSSADVLYDKGGPQQQIRVVTSTSSRNAQTIFIEFDRFSAGSDDFFADWDNVASAGSGDSYASFIPVIERMDGGAWGAGGANDTEMKFLSVGMSVVQAPTGINRTCTIINGSPGNYFSSGIATAVGVAQNCRPRPFHYVAGDWDNITAIHVLTEMAYTGGGTGNETVTTHVQALDVAAGSISVTERYSEFTAGSTVNRWLHRSQNILDQIQDGDYLGVGFSRGEAQSTNQPIAWFEIIQEDFNKTLCQHEFGHAEGYTNADIGAVPDYSPDAALFDPQWYQGFPEELILSTRIIGALRDMSAAEDPEEQLVIDADLRTGWDSSSTIQGLAPRVTATPSATAGYKVADFDITSANPLNLAGKRRFGVSYTGSFGANSLPSGVGLAVALNVPNREFLEIGPVFELGAFNPEGCASTSAGLGDPGLLVITNGSTLPKKFNPQAAGSDSAIEDAGVPTPFLDELPSTQVDDTAASPAGGLDLGFYNYRYTFRNCCTNKESDPSDVVTVDTTGASPAAQVTLSFAGVRIPSDPQICEICVYRTVVSLTELGLSEVVLAKVGCFNVDDTTVFVDTVADDELDFLNDGLSLLNGPMPCVPIVVDFRNRLFGMGDIPNLTPAGLVTVTEGSDIVEGNGDVEWDRCLEGKFIQVAGDCRPYEIDRVLPPAAGISPPIARLKLVDAYEGASDTGLTYTLCGRPNRLYIGEPLEPECWPAANFLDIEPGDGDRLMGAVSNFDRLVICKRRKTYVLTFREQPAVEVIVPSRISSDIGCIGPRTFAQVASGSVWLSDRGLALYDGRTVQHVPESELMNDMFVDPDNPRYVRRDENGRVIDAVGVFYPKREQYLLLLPTIQTERGCDLMVVWDVALKNITVLEFCQEFQSMVVGRDAEGNERVYLGDVNGFVWIFDIGYTDGVGYPNATGTVRGTVTSAGVNNQGADVLVYSPGGFITGGLPSLAGLSGVAGLTPTFDGDTMGLAGVCVFTRSADAALDDPWVKRTVYAATNDTLYVTPPWDSEAPVAGDDFMIGAIEFRCLFKPNNYGTDDVSKRNWAQVVVHEKESFASKLRVELLPDFSQVDPEELTVIDPVTQETGEGRIFRMDYEKGRQRRPVGRDVHFFEAVRFTNFAPEEPIRVINHVLLATPRSSK